MRLPGRNPSQACVSLSDHFSCLFPFFLPFSLHSHSRTVSYPSLPHVRSSLLALHPHYSLLRHDESRGAMSTITCHGYAGQLWFKNVQCPGSSSCCGDVTECTPQRLCKKSNGQLVRASCAEKDWDLSVCAQICLYGMALSPLRLFGNEMALGLVLRVKWKGIGIWRERGSTD
jgi:hypothetical protein